MHNVALIVGLGNPGATYAGTRHNAGFRFIERLQFVYNFSLKHESRFNADAGDFILDGRRVRILAPATFVNLSGRAVAPFAKFYRIPPSQILVAHDELDLPPGCARLKQRGGHGGHNGVRDLISALGDDAFARLRIGIGHPGPDRDVSNYVLSKPLVAEQVLLDAAIERALEVLPAAVAGDMESAMRQLHAPPPELNESS